MADNMFGGYDEDLYASSSPLTGASTGATIGAMFGPVGAVAGGFIGGAVSMFDGSSGKRKRARIKATVQSYAFAKDVYAYGEEGRKQVQKDYEASSATVLARYSASGADTQSEGYRALEGKLIRERDKFFADIDAEIQEYRAGPGFEWLRNDVERQTSAYGHTGRHTAYRKIGLEGRTGYSVFTDAQKNKLISHSWNPDRAESGPNIKQYQEYGDRLRPEMEMYEKSIYGTADDKTAYTKHMDERITAANEWYRGVRHADSVSRKARAEFNMRGARR